MLKSKLVKRNIVNLAFQLVAIFSSLFGIIVLVAILFEVLKRGYTAINWDFFTKLPKPPGESGGGIVNSIIGSTIITLVASIGAIPLGVLSAIYSAEFGRGTKLGKMVHFTTDTLTSVPSIVVGLFAYTLFVLPMKTFSAIAGSFALAIIAIPLIHRITEEMLFMVPDSLREAGLALGATYPYIVRKVCLKSAKVGIITAVLLAIARISGETAPLLFTALNSPFLSFSLFKPMGNVNVTIFTYAMSPYDDWRSIAWGASFVITVVILIISIVSRTLFKRVRNG